MLCIKAQKCSQVSENTEIFKILFYKCIYKILNLTNGFYLFCIFYPEWRTVHFIIKSNGVQTASSSTQAGTHAQAATTEVWVCFCSYESSGMIFLCDGSKTSVFHMRILAASLACHTALKVKNYFFWMGDVSRWSKRWFQMTEVISLWGSQVSCSLMLDHQTMNILTSFSWVGLLNTFVMSNRSKSWPLITDWSLVLTRGWIFHS